LFISHHFKLVLRWASHQAVVIWSVSESMEGTQRRAHCSVSHPAQSGNQSFTGQSLVILTVKMANQWSMQWSMSGPSGKAPPTRQGGGWTLLSVKQSRTVIGHTCSCR